MSSVIRQSNIELLRILAMLFVLIGHANGLVLGLPATEDFQNNPFKFILSDPVYKSCCRWS